MKDHEEKCVTNLSSNKRINHLLTDIFHKLKGFLEEQARNINQLTAIGKAMSAEQNIAVILEMILKQARRFTAADGGTLYLVSPDEKSLVFHVVHNETLHVHIGGSSGKEVTLPNVALFTADGTENATNVSAYVANTGEIVNIPDVYHAKGFNFEGTQKFDASLNYRSRSMLVIPMKDHEDTVIGVLQLINATDPLTGEIIPFSPEVTDMASALASQAAVMLTQQQLIREMKELFESFIRAIATAIDEKSKYTGGHIQRVAELTMMIAHAVNETDEGPCRDIRFSEEELEELRIAAWMHDTGKIVTPEFVVDKSTKLETVFDRIELIKTRWQAARLARRLAAEKQKLSLVGQHPDIENAETVDRACDEDITMLDSLLELIVESNKGGEFLQQEKIDKLNEIAGMTYTENQTRYPFLTPDELFNLSIQKGTLTEAERETINSHVLMTSKILAKLPWPKKLSNVPSIAGAHHEKLDGTGYPDGITAEGISMQARIMALADVFEALTAPDRPYKSPMPLSQALNILGFMAKDNHIDKNILDLFISTKVYKQYAEKHLASTQIDA